MVDKMDLSSIVTGPTASGITGNYFDWLEVDNEPDRNNLLTEQFREDLELANQTTDPTKQPSYKQNKVAPNAFVNITAEDKEVSIKQPEPHESNKTIIEAACGCCMRVESCDLNKREYRFYQQFMQTMVVDYDGKNQMHERDLARFYRMACDLQPGQQPQWETAPDGTTMLSESWKDLGFQQRNPRTDFRGGGHLSLLCLIYFAQQYSQEFKEMISVTKDRQELMWLTAISSINITHNLIIFFYMNQGNAPPQTKLRAGRPQFKRFCKFNSFAKRSFFEIHAFALRHLYHSWLLTVNEGGGPEKMPELILQFNSLMEKAKEAVSELLEEPVGDLAKFERRASQVVEGIRQKGGVLKPPF